MARHKLKKRDIHGPRTFYDVRLDLHGMFSEEAMRKVEKTIAANPGRSILVIHSTMEPAFSGMPSGARFRRIACPMVRDYVFGEDINAPGLDGVTVIYT